jgi:hypothetical protein
MDSTMNRTKKYLAYFGKSFLKDKVALTMILLIIVTLSGIIWAMTLDPKGSETPPAPSPNVTSAYYTY